MIPIDGELECGKHIDLVHELPKRIEAQERDDFFFGEVSGHPIANRGPNDRSRAQNRHDSAFGLCRKTVDFSLGRNLVREKGFVGVGAQRMSFRQKVRVCRVRTVEQRLAPLDELAQSGLSRRIDEVHRADGFEFVRPNRLVRGGWQKAQVHERIDSFAGENAGDSFFRRRRGQVEGKVLRFLACRTRGRDVDGDDPCRLRIILEQPDEVSPEKRRRSRDGNDPVADFASRSGTGVFRRRFHAERARHYSFVRLLQDVRRHVSVSQDDTIVT